MTHTTHPHHASTMDIKNILNENDPRNTSPPQQIVYTGPVYQLHPPPMYRYPYSYPPEYPLYPEIPHQYPRYTPPRHHHHSVASVPIPRARYADSPSPVRQRRYRRHVSPPARPFRRAGLPAAFPRAERATYEEESRGYDEEWGGYYGRRRMSDCRSDEGEKRYEKAGVVLEDDFLREIDCDMARNARRRERLPRAVSPTLRACMPRERYSQFEQGFRAVTMDRELARRDEDLRRRKAEQQKAWRQARITGPSWSQGRAEMAWRAREEQQGWREREEEQMWRDRGDERWRGGGVEQENWREGVRVEHQARRDVVRGDEEMWRDRGRVREESWERERDDGQGVVVKRSKSVSSKSVSVKSVSSKSVSPKRKSESSSMRKMGNSEVVEISSGNDSEVIQVDDDSDTVSEQEGASEMDVEMRLEKERLAKMTPRAADPDEPYPETKDDFEGIPPAAVGDLLQLWEFVTAFSKTLKLTSFSLRHLQQAIVHGERCTLLDACLTRLVRTIVADRALVQDLDIADSVVKALTAKGTKNVIVIILEHLPWFLASDEDDDDVDDQFLHELAKKLRGSSDKWAFYRNLEPAGKLRILRELVDYAAMTDVLRECVTDSMEHAEEEKKKAKGENAANRKKLDQQLRELKSELLEYRIKNGLIDVTQESDKSDKEKGGVQNGKKESAGEDSGKDEMRSRKDKLLAAQKEKKEEEDRRVKERGAELIIARIDKVRVQLKALKNIRLRNRGGGRDGELFDGSLASPNMPFTAPHEDPVRTHPMGTDREDRCYWFFEGCGKIWIENIKTREWCTVNSEEGLDMLIRWLSSYRSNEQELKKTLKKRKEHIVTEIQEEARRMEAAAEAEAQKTQSEAEPTPRLTRAGKRKADSKAKAKTKKSKTGTFLDYRNLEK